MYTLPHFNSGLLLHGKDAPIHQNKRLDDGVTLCRNGRRRASRAEQQLQTQPGSSATVSRHQGQRQIRFSGPVSDSSRWDRLDTVTLVPSSSTIPATGPDFSTHLPAGTQKRLPCSKIVIFFNFLFNLFPFCSFPYINFGLGMVLFFWFLIRLLI